MAETHGARSMISDFCAFGRARFTGAIGLIVAGAVLEGVGVFMLVPVISLILDTQGGAAGDGLAEPVFQAVGLQTAASRIGFVLALFALVLALRFVVLLYRDDHLMRLQQDFVFDLRQRAFRAIARMPWADVIKLRQDPIGHALTRDVDRVSHAVNQLVHGAIAVVMLLVQLGLALALAPIVTVVVAILGLALFRALRWLRNRAAHQGQELTDEDLTLFQTVGGFLRGLKPAKAHGLEGDYVAAFERAAGRVAENRRVFAFDFSLARQIMQTASGGIAIVAILLGVFVLDTPPESLIVTLIVLARLYTPLQALQNTVQSVRHAAPGYLSARGIAGPNGGAEAPAVRAPAVPLETAPGIVFSGVSCGGGEIIGEQAGLRPMLGDLSAEIPAGQVTALAGESGAGKSTLCDLAVGLLVPDSGQVLLDGAAIDAVVSGRLRASVAYVGQEPFLFEDSLRHNLCWGCPPVADDAIWQALETVGAAGLARGLEGGLDGRIRAEGMRFSGGERQRLRLARALLRGPRFMVLDEATNALDPDAEAKVLRAVLAARKGATVLMVSHRPANLRLADHAILLERGKLAETGPIRSLLSDPASKISALLSRQALTHGGEPATERHRKSDISVNSGVD